MQTVFEQKSSPAMQISQVRSVYEEKYISKQKLVPLDGSKSLL